MLLRNVLELAHGTDAISSSAATVLAQCLFLPFQSPHHLDHFHWPRHNTVHEKLLFICYRTTYAPLSSLSLDEWNHLQCTDLCCSIAATLLHYPKIDPTAVLLQMEWMRYMYLLRDRILQYPVACASLLHKILLFFHAPNNEQAIEASGASTALLRLLLDIASSNMHEAVFVLEVLVKMRSQYSWIAWPHKSNLLTTLQTVLPTLNSLFQSPPKQDVTADDDDNSSRSITTSSRQSIQLVHRMRVAIKQLAATVAHSHGDGAKLD
ncbi:hypothetical protein AaE_006548 [Aphanomyces astaci]|uniref:Uncharacterized protein n=1 Tax=Aphanomyces astaci TaxID=112090 RepID=A0A6A5AJ75_APHAT|nr:hypothetical protein AaE_006548 [Aphanomyces astaci]